MPSAGACLVLALLAADAVPPAAPAVATPTAVEPRPPQAPASPEDKPGTPPPSAEGKSAGERPATAEKAGPAEKEEKKADALPRKAAADKAGESAPAARPLPNGTLPPSLTARALLDELRRSAKSRQTEQSSIGEQRRKLEALQKEIEASRAAMREETKKLQELLAAGAAAAPAGKKGAPVNDDAAIDALTKTVRGMKPNAAAAMLAKLDRGLAAAILGRMRPADAALLLDKMEPATSASLVSLLAGRDRS